MGGRLIAAPLAIGEGERRSQARRGRRGQSKPAVGDRAAWWRMTPGGRPPVANDSHSQVASGLGLEPARVNSQLTRDIRRYALQAPREPADGRRGL